MPRLFYIALGAAAGVVAVRRAARAAEALTPTSIAGSLVQSVREFAADVREAMAEREEEIRTALGLDDLDGPDGAAPALAGGTDARHGGMTPDGTAHRGTARDAGPVAGLADGVSDDDDFDPERTMRLVPGARLP